MAPQRDPRVVREQKEKSAAVRKRVDQTDAAPNPVALNGHVVHEPAKRKGTGERTGGPACLRLMRNIRYTASEPTCPACKVRGS